MSQKLNISKLIWVSMDGTYVNTTFHQKFDDLKTHTKKARDKQNINGYLPGT